MEEIEKNLKDAQLDQGVVSNDQLVMIPKEEKVRVREGIQAIGKTVLNFIFRATEGDRGPKASYQY